MYEAAESLTAARRKELGAFYTPPAMASQLVRWAVRRPTDAVIDPSFGGLVFLAAAYDRLRALGVDESDARDQILGGELDEQAHATALGDPRVGASELRLVHGDFLGFSPGHELPVVDAVVGNPPYVRYRPGFPARFDNIEHARAFCRPFFDYYNHEHRHSGIGLMTPASVHHGRAEQLHAHRARVLDAAYATTPERFVRQAPKPPALPTAAWINKPDPEETAH